MCCWTVMMGRSMAAIQKNAVRRNWRPVCRSASAHHIRASVIEPPQRSELRSFRSYPFRSDRLLRVGHLMQVRAATVAFVSLLFAGAQSRADSIALLNGGEIRGELLADAKTAARDPTVVIRTLSGATVSVVREEISAVVRRRPVLEEYETRRRRISDTVAGQWELAEWCRQNSLSKE